MKRRNDNFDAEIGGQSDDKRSRVIFELDPPFLQVYQKREGTVLVRWEDRSLKTQQQLVTTTVSRLDSEAANEIPLEDLEVSLVGYEFYITGPAFEDSCDSVERFVLYLYWFRFRPIS